MMEIFKPRRIADIQSLNLEVRQKVREKMIRNKGGALVEDRVIRSEVFQSLEEWVSVQEKPVSFHSIQASIDEFDINVTLEQWKCLLDAGGNIYCYS